MGFNSAFKGLSYAVLVIMNFSSHVLLLTNRFVSIPIKYRVFQKELYNFESV
jgi:hypothetical protein